MRKTLACILTILLILTVVGCSNAKLQKEFVKIEEGTPWYLSEYLNPVNADELCLDNVNPILMSPSAKMYVKFYDVTTSEECQELIYYLPDSNTPEYLDYSQYVSKDTSYVRDVIAFEDNGDIYVLLVEYILGDFCNSIWKLDVDKGELTDKISVHFDNEYPESISVYNCKVKDGKIYLLFDYFDESNNAHNGFKVITSQGENVSEFDVAKQVLEYGFGANGDIWCLLRDLEVTSNQVSDCYRFELINHLSGEAESLQVSNEFIEKYWSGSSFNDEYVYVQNSDLTITRYDAISNEEELYFDYNHCDANISDLAESVFWCYDDSIVFLDDYWMSSENMDFATVIECTRQETNPNIGKKVIFAATPFSVDYMEAEGIRKFNQESAEFFCYLTMKYRVTNYEKSEASEIYEQNKYEAEFAMLSELQQDIVAGNGPDILINFGEYSLLNDSKYLIDLSKIVNEDINQDEYFINYFDAYATGDNYYQLPLCAATGGIYANNIDDEKNGFTFDEYQTLVEEKWKGFDPLNQYFGRNTVLGYIQSYNYEKYKTEDRISLDNEDFRQCMQYLSKVSDKPTGMNSGSSFVQFSNICSNLSSMQVHEDYFLYGFPSLEGRGACAYIPESVAITTCSNLPEQAEIIINSLLSYEVQSAQKEYNPINIRAFDEYAVRAVKKANETIYKNFSISDYYSNDVIEIYKSYLHKGKVPMLSDSIVLSILIEEAQPFFAGQKTIDEVIPVIESRVNTMLEERK